MTRAQRQHVAGPWKRARRWEDWVLVAVVTLLLAAALSPWWWTS